MADRNGNANCLEGLECPQCGEHSMLHIHVMTKIEMFDGGSGAHEDLEWDESSYVECPSCGHGGKAKLFMIAGGDGYGQESDPHQ